MKESFHIQGFVVVNKYESRAFGNRYPIEDSSTQKALLNALNTDDVAFRANDQHGKEVRYYHLPEHVRNIPAIQQHLNASSNTDEWYIVITDL